MGTSTLLDYALFQLTPTRTRCDLVLFYGGKTEKLASGLFEPFVSHLEFAKDQISKGGYSIKLCPPTTYAPWFTKATFERFVRFVSTPAVLERFVNLEKEIFHIESSNELSNTNVTAQREEGTNLYKQGSRLGSNSNMRRLSNSSKVKGEVAISGDAAPEGNSKIQLQRLLETRKTLLRKEQAMAYARGLVAGFEIDNIDDLISFADAFGASRLREACTNFKELCKKKQGDGLWMEELAAMEACPPSELSFLGTSGIVLNNDGDLVSNGTLDASRSDSTTSYASSDSKKDDHSAMPDQMLSNNTKVKVAMPWPNQMPHYMYNFQNPIQQLPPYQGYPFPIPPHYATNMQWPPSLKESGPTKKEKSLNNKGFEHSGEDEKTESDDSEADSDSELYMRQNKGHSSKDSHRKKHRKKSSKTVVIRNINYITSKRRNGEKAGASDESSDEEDFIDEDSLRQQVDDAVGLLEKSHKSNLSNHKKRGSHKSNGISNGSNDVTAQDDPVEGGKKSENWDVLQNLLMRDEESNVNEVERSHPIDAQDQHYTVRDSGDGTALTNIAALDLESEKVPKQQMASDSFVVTERNGGFEERNRLEDIENAENLRSSLKRRDYTDGDLVIPQRMEDTGSGLRGILATESSIIKPGRGEDWFVINHSGQPENQNSTNEDLIFNGDSLNVEKSRKDVVVDDSFMVHAGPAVDNLYESQWRTDISMDADLTLPSKPENGTVKDSYEALGSHEPDDLCVVLERDSGFESARESWTTDHGIDILFMETDRRSSNGEISNGADKKLTPNCDSTIAKKEETKGRRVPGKEARPKVLPGFPRNNKIDAVSKSRKPSLANRPLVQKSKLEKEEEMRKKMEELSIQRQKRIAERTAAGGFAPAATKKTPLESKEVKGSTKFDKNKTHSNTQQTNKVSSTKIRAA